MVAHIEVVARIAAHSMFADRIADCNIVVVRTVVERTADRIGFVVAVAHIVVEHTDFVARTAVARTAAEHTDFVARTAAVRTAAERTVVERTAAEHTAAEHIVAERTAGRIGFVVVVARIVAHIVVARTVVERTDFVSIVESPAAVE